MKKSDIFLSTRKNPLVSVIMPVYNVESYVEEAIESILNQSFSDFEFIIIDDCSTDNTLDIVHSYKDDRVIIIRNIINSGNYPSRNKGIKIARGKYIAVMDGDDIAMPDRFQKQIKVLENDATILANGTAFAFSNGQQSLIPYSYDMIKVTLLRNNMFLHPSLIIRKEVLHEIDYYNESYYFSSDYDLVCKIAQKGKIINLHDILMQYRLHENQISSTSKIRQTKYAEKIRLTYLKRCGFQLLEYEEKIFTLMMKDAETIHFSDIITIADKIKKQNQTLGCFNPDILNYFFKGIFAKISS